MARLSLPQLFQIVLVIGVAATTGALVGGTPFGQSFVFALVSIVGVWAYAAWWKQTYDPQVDAASDSNYAGIREVSAEQALLEQARGRLDAANAEIALLHDRLRASEQASRGHGEALGQLGALLLPRLERLEAEFTELLAAPDQLAERRGRPSQLVGDLRVTAAMARELLNFGRAEVAARPVTPERLELRRALANLAGDLATLAIDDSAPTLVYSDRALFGAFIENLVSHAQSVGDRPTLTVRSTPQKGDIVTLDIEFSGGVPVTGEFTAAVISGDPLRWATSLLAESNGSLALAVAARIALRLGGTARWQQPRGAMAPTLSFRFLMTVAPERRAIARALTLSDLGVDRQVAY